MEKPHQLINEFPSFDSSIEDSKNLSNLMIEDSLEENGDNDIVKDDEVTFNGFDVQTLERTCEHHLDLNKVPEEIPTPTIESAENFTPKNESTIVELDESEFDLNKLLALDFGVKKKEVKDMIKMYLDYLN